MFSGASFAAAFLSGRDATAAGMRVGGIVPGMLSLAAMFVRPALPVWLVLLLWAGVLAGCWLGLRRSGVRPAARLGLWGLRAAATTLLALVLLMPERRREDVQTELPVLAVAVDVSASMHEKTALGADAPSRAAQALELLQNGGFKSGLGHFRVWWFEVADGAEEVTAPPAGEKRFAGARTLLGSGMNQIASRLQGQNTAGILLLSDGLDQSGMALTPAARSVPLYALELEKERPAAAPKPDVWIAEVNYPRRAVVSWQTAIDVMVRRQAGGGAASMPVVLAGEGGELQSKTLTWAPGESFQMVSFEFAPAKTGQLVLRAEVRPPPAADSQPANNRRDFLMDVMDPENRVLYLEGVPRWEFKFLKRALLADKNILLSAFVSNGAGGFVNFSEDEKGSSGGFSATLPPFTKEGLDRYKTVILGDLPAAAMRPADIQGLREFVERGGGLLCVGGPSSCGAGGLYAVPELAAVLPAVPEAGAKLREGRFAVDVTTAGKDHAALQGLNPELPLPPLLSVCDPVTVNPAASVLLATAEGVPVFVARPAGQGKAAMLLSDSFWHWRLGETETDKRGSRYQNFYAQLLYWLGPQRNDQNRNELLQMFVAANEVDARQPLTIGATLENTPAGRDPGLVCRITPAAGGPGTLLPMIPAALGQNVGLTRATTGFACEFRPPEPGGYTLAVTTPDGTRSVSTRLLVREPFQEQIGAPANPAYLKSLCEATGGRFVPWEERGRLPDLIPHQPREFRSINESALWPNPVWLGLLIFLLSAEWYWRRRLHLA